MLGRVFTATLDTIVISKHSYLDYFIIDINLKHSLLGTTLSNANGVKLCIM